MIFENKSLIKFLAKKNYQTWIDVVKQGVNLLVINNKCTSKLTEKIFESTKQYGPYYVIMPHVALLHAEAGNHCLAPALSAMVLEEAIEFGYPNQQKRFAQIIFTLSAPNDQDHMEMIKKFALAMQNEQMISHLLNVKNTKQLIKILNF